MAILYNSNYDKTMPFSDVCYPMHLVANMELMVTVPGTAINKYSAQFGYNDTSNVFVRLNGTPTIPTDGTVVAEQYTEFKPGADGSQRYVQGGDVIHFITPDVSAYVGFSLRSLP